MTEMRVLTVRQPWAWAIIHGGKDVENRVRNIAGSYRGPVAIHVAGKYAEVGLDFPALDIAASDWCETNHCEGRRQHPWTRHTGKVIGVVDLVGVHGCQSHRDGSDVPDCVGSGTPLAMTCSPWAEFRPGEVTHHLVLADPRPLDEPIPFKGGLGLRRLDDATRTLVESEVAS